MADFDLAVIGGGINGAGIARDAAGRGLRVLLVEQNDLASGTSSASTKLIHGGLRYLEHYAFGLVRDALAEREVMLRMAPHLVRPLRFVLPANPELRSSLVLRIGLFVYDHLGGRKILPPTRTLDLTHHAVGVPLKRRFRHAFEYSDCWVDDARLVVLNAVDAAERGATIRTRTRCMRVERGEDWTLILGVQGRREAVTARALVNAAGPWVAEVAERVIRTPGPAPLRLVKGSHIVVRKLFDHDRAYIFQNRDGRIAFAIPYERDFTLIGTTDENFTGDPASVAASRAEIHYLCETANEYFRIGIGAADVVWAYAGVRSLYDDGASKPEDVTRDYVLTLDAPHRQPPLLTVYGGKITTYRRLAEAAMEKLAPYFSMSGPWTADAPLPGGDVVLGDIDALIAQTRRRWPFLPAPQAERMARAYGTRIDRILGEARSFDDLGAGFGAGLTEAEIRHLTTYEWARTADDILWRRTKLGLHMSAEQRLHVEDHMAALQNRTSAGLPAN